VFKPLSRPGAPFCQPDGAEVTFIRSASGAVTGLMLHQDDHDGIALKQ
jgi:hypothetical protein